HMPVPAGIAVESMRVISARDIAIGTQSLQNDTLAVAIVFGDDTDSLRVRVHFPAGNHDVTPLIDLLPPLAGGHRGDRTEIIVPIGALQPGRKYCVEIEPCTTGKKTCGREQAMKFDVQL